MVVAEGAEGEGGGEDTNPTSWRISSFRSLRSTPSSSSSRFRSIFSVVVCKSLSASRSRSRLTMVLSSVAMVVVVMSPVLQRLLGPLLALPPSESGPKPLKLYGP